MALFVSAKLSLLKLSEGVCWWWVGATQRGRNCLLFGDEDNFRVLTLQLWRRCNCKVNVLKAGCRQAWHMPHRSGAGSAELSTDMLLAALSSPMYAPYSTSRMATRKGPRHAADLPAEVWVKVASFLSLQER